MRTANPINIRAIDHVVIRAVAVDAMLEFYIDTLGRQGGSAPDHQAPNMDHVCLQVDPWDAAAICAHLESRGIEVGEIANRYGATGSGPSIYLRDPEGNTVELKGNG